MPTAEGDMHGPRFGLIEKIRRWNQNRRAKRITALYRREASPPPKGTKVPKIFGYIHYKAFSYLIQGPDKYRKDDFFGHPPKDFSMDRLEAIKLGCQQILKWRGISPESALEGIEIQGFYDLLSLFHFQLKQQAALADGENLILDRMEMQHVMTSEEITLYNRVRVQEEQ